MSYSGRTFRLFVSSTFTDLKAERNALQERVFPRLRDLCREHGTRFQAIDLRWGVSSEAALDQQTMAICMEEIARCRLTSPRPNFIVLLGDRYGWRPLPHRIPGADFEVVVRSASAAQLRLLEEWYPCDRNAIPPEHCLRAREGRYEHEEVWAPVEEALREVVFRAAKDLRIESFDRPMYGASATEQEVLMGALGVGDAPEHVFCFFRSIDGLPTDANAADFLDFDAGGRPDRAAGESLARLKERLRRKLPGNVWECRVPWTGAGPGTDHLDLLCDAAFDRLSRVIRKEIARIERADPLDREIEAQNGFGAERARHFVGREEVLARARAHVSGDDRAPLVLWGPSGVGKSAVIARVAQEARKAGTGTRTIVRFIGATPGSSGARPLLGSLCQELARLAGREKEPVSGDYRLLIQQVPGRLREAASRGPFLLLLDAMDQLAPEEQRQVRVWLPAVLPPGARVVISTTPGEYLDAARRTIPESNLVAVGPMPPAAAERVIELWLEDARRTIQPAQREALLRAFEASGLPLYLRLAFEEVRLWRSFDPVSPMAGGVSGIVARLLVRLEDEARHGRVLVSHGLGYLATARHGLSEDEMLDLLSLDEEVLSDFRRRAPRSPPTDRLPVVVWSRIRFDLDRYLTERMSDGGTLMAFFHRHVAEGVAQRYLLDGGDRRYHAAIARYFGTQALWTGEPGARTPNLRRAAELPHQQMRAGLWDDLRGTLTDLEFVEAKCAAGMTYDLVHDYGAAGEEWPESREEPPAEGGMRDPAPAPSPEEGVGAFGQFVSTHAHVFARDPMQVMPFACNYAGDGPVVEAGARGLERRGPGTFAWIELVDRPPLLRSPSLRWTLEGHEGEVRGVAVTADARTAVSGGRDGTLRTWDLASGMCSQVVRTHEAGINGVALSKCGRFAAAAGDDGVVQVLEDGAPLATLDADDGTALCVAISRGGRHVACGTSEGRVHLWDVASGSRAKIFEGHFGPVNDVAISADGRTIVSGSSDCRVRVWDAAEAATRRCLEAGLVPVRGVACDDKARTLVSSSGQLPDAGGIVVPALLYGSRVRFWTPRGEFEDTGHVVGDRGGRALGVLATAIHDICVTPDGRVALSGGYDGALCIWDVPGKRLRRRFVAHAGSVLGTAIDGAGSVGVSAGTDGRVRVWDLEREPPLFLPPERRIARIGGGARASPRERLDLVFRNRRIRRWVVLPLVSVAVGILFWREIRAFREVGGLGWSLPPYADGILGVVMVWMILFSIEWRSLLKGDTHLWRRPLIPRPLRAVLGVLALPILMAFAVLNCPLCGHRMAGRRGLFSCHACGFRDSGRAPGPARGAGRG